MGGRREAGVEVVIGEKAGEDPMRASYIFCALGGTHFEMETFPDPNNKTW